jgi:hypothetical protein
MADTIALSRRSRRTALIRRRATVVSLGALLGAFVLVGVTTPPPAPSTSATVAPVGPVVLADSRLSQGAPAAPAAPVASIPRRIRTRQS